MPDFRAIGPACPSFSACPANPSWSDWPTADAACFEAAGACSEPLRPGRPVPEIIPLACGERSRAGCDPVRVVHGVPLRVRYPSRLLHPAEEVSGRRHAPRAARPWQALRPILAAADEAIAPAKAGDPARLGVVGRSCPGSGEIGLADRGGGGGMSPRGGAGRALAGRRGGCARPPGGGGRSAGTGYGRAPRPVRPAVAAPARRTRRKSSRGRMGAPRPRRAFLGGSQWRWAHAAGAGAHASGRPGCDGGRGREASRVGRDLAPPGPIALTTHDQPASAWRTKAAKGWLLRVQCANGRGGRWSLRGISPGSASGLGACARPPFLSLPRSRRHRLFGKSWVSLRRHHQVPSALSSNTASWSSTASTTSARVM